MKEIKLSIFIDDKIWDETVRNRRELYQDDPETWFDYEDLREILHDEDVEDQILGAISDQINIEVKK